MKKSDLSELSHVEILSKRCFYFFIFQEGSFSLSKVITDNVTLFFVIKKLIKNSKYPHLKEE